MPSKSLSGDWVHPADGDNYPTELTMKVVESRGAFGVIAWTTDTTGHPEPFNNRSYEWSFTHSIGSPSILMSVRSKDGTWSPVTPMVITRWHVEGGTNEAARARMHEFFTELGYTKKERKS